MSMEPNNGAEVLLMICVMLDEIKSLTATVIKELDYEIKMETEEVRRVLNVVIGGGKKKMDNGKEKDILLWVWMRLAKLISEVDKEIE